MDSVLGEDPTLPLDFDHSVNMSHIPDLSPNETLPRPQLSVSNSHHGSKGSDSGPTHPTGVSPASGRISPASNRNMKDFGTREGTNSLIFIAHIVAYTSTKQTYQRLINFRRLFDLLYTFVHLQQISDLKKENFSLKLRIFYMEERMLEQFSGDHDQLWRTNIELKVECDSLRKELSEKHDLLVKASNAVACMDSGDPEELQKAKNEAMQEVTQLREIMNEKVEAAEKELQAAHQDSEHALQQAMALQKKHDDLIAENKDLADALSKANEALEEANAKSDQLRHDDSYLKPSPAQEEKIASLEKQLDELSAELQDKNRSIRELQGSLSTKQTFIDLLTEEKQTTNNEQVEPLLREVESLRHKLKESESALSNSEQFEGKAHQRYQEHINEQQQRLDEYELATKQMTGELEKREAELQASKDSLRESEEKVEELTEKLDHCTAEANDSNAKAMKNINKRDKAITGLTQVVYKKDAEISSLQNEISTLEEEISQLRKDIDDKDLKTNQLLADIRSHESSKNSTSKDELIQQLREQLKESDGALQDALDEKDRLENEKEKSSRDFMIQIREKTRQLDRFKTQASDYEQTVLSLDSDIREKDKELQELAAKHKNLLRDFQLKENERLRAIRERDELVKQCEDEKMRFSELVSKMRRRSSSELDSTSSLADLDTFKRVRDLEDELRKKNEALTEANIAKEQAHAELDKSQFEFEKALRSRDDEIHKGSRVIAMRDVEIRQLKDLLRNKEEALHDSESQHQLEFNKLSREAAALKGKLRTSEEELSKIRTSSASLYTDSNRRSNFDTDTESSQKSDKFLRDQIDELKHQLALKDKQLQKLKRPTYSFTTNNVEMQTETASDTASDSYAARNVTFNHNSYHRRPKAKKKYRNSRETSLHNHNNSYYNGTDVTSDDSAKEFGQPSGFDRLRQVHAHNRTGNMTIDTTFGIPLDQTSYLSMPDGYHSDSDVQTEDHKGLSAVKLRQLLQNTRDQLSDAIREVADLKRTCSENIHNIDQLESLLREKSAENIHFVKKFEEANKEKMAKESEVLGLLARIRDRDKDVAAMEKRHGLSTRRLEDSASDNDSAVSCRSRRLSGDESDGMSSLSRKELRGIITNLRKKLANAEKVNELLKKQMHSSADNSVHSSTVDPQLVTQLTAEVESLKNQLKLHHEKQEKHKEQQTTRPTSPKRSHGTSMLPSKLPVPRNYKGGHQAVENPLRPELDRARMLNRKLNERVAATEQTVRQQTDKLNKCKAALKAAGIASPPMSPMRGARSVPNLYTAGYFSSEKVSTAERTSSTSVDTSEVSTQTPSSTDSGISSMSPRSEQRFNSLIQAQAKELSTLRQQLKKSREACRRLQTEMDIVARYMKTLLSTAGDELDPSLVSGVTEEVERSRKLVAKLRRGLTDNIDEVSPSDTDSDHSSLATPVPLLAVENRQIEFLKNELNEKNNLLNELRDKVKLLEANMRSPRDHSRLHPDPTNAFNPEKWRSSPNLHPVTATPVSSTERFSVDPVRKRPSSAGSPFRSRDYGLLTPASSHQSLHSASEEEMKLTRDESSRFSTRLGDDDDRYTSLPSALDGHHVQHRTSLPTDQRRVSPNSSMRRSMPLYQRTIAVTEYLPPNIATGKERNSFGSSSKHPMMDKDRLRPLPTTSDASHCTASFGGRWASESVTPRKTDAPPHSNIRIRQSPISELPLVEESSCDDASSHINHKLAREVDRLRRRLSDTKRINRSLKEELDLTNKTLMKTKESLVPRHQKSPHQNAGLLAEHLSEIRGLRQRLEQTVITNDKLREKLEARLDETDVSFKEHLSANIFVEAERGNFSHSTEVRSLQQKLGKLEVENEKLRNRLKAEEKAHRTYEDAIQEMKSMQQSLAGKSNKIDQLTQHMQQLQYELEQQSSLSNKLGIELSDKDCDISRLKTQLEHVEKENSSIRQAEENAKLSASKIYGDLQNARSHSDECVQLIESLKSELSLYEKLHASKKAASSFSPKHSSFDLGELLQEIRSLRIQLERSIDANAALRRQLEVQINSPRKQDESALTTINIHHVTPHGSGHKDKSKAKTSPPSARRKLKLETYIGDDNLFMTPPATASSGGEEHCFNFNPNLSRQSGISHKKDPIAVSSPVKESGLFNETEDLLIKPFYSVGGPYTLCKTDDFMKLQQSVAKTGLIARSTDNKLAEKMKLSHRPATPEKKTMKELWRSVSSLCQHVDDSERLLRLFWPVLIPYSSQDFTVGDGRARSYSSSGVATGGQCSSTESPNSAGRQQTDLTAEYSVNSETDGLRREVGKLRRRLSTQDRLLQTTVERLHNTNRLKEGIEHAIVKQLSRTHDVLRKARGNLEAKVQEPG